jgi:bifunctional enzyme CysN/CysC
MMAAPLAICLAGHVDHGKSTLLGRLLHELGLLPEGKVAALQAASEARGVPLEWSFVLDAFQLERDQAITLDTTHVRVRTPRRELTIVDAPGHRDLIRNLVTGAADTTAALMVVDAKEGIEAQTRRHLSLLRLLGIADVVVAVNKMDLVDWQEGRFVALRDELEHVLAALQLTPRAIVPVAARSGANLIARAAEAPWWRGPTLLAALEALPDPQSARTAQGPLRLPVQNVYRLDERRIVAGRVTSGTLRAEVPLLLLPANRVVSGATLEGWPASPPDVPAGDNASVVIADPVLIQRGDLLCDPATPPKLTAVFDADVFWLGRGELAAGRRLHVRFGFGDTAAQIAAIHHVHDDATLGPRIAAAIPEGAVARITLRCDTPVPIDDAAVVPAGARFVLVEQGAIVGGGIADASGYPDQRTRGAAGDHLVAVRHDVTATERGQRSGHVGAVVWLTGLSGAGKSTLAMALERRLFDLGWFVYTLDGDNVRRGLNADLGFAPEARQENIRRVGEVAALFADAGAVCITAFISPYRDDRARARAAAGERRFLEIHVRSDLATCEARDPKGFYRRARAGTLKDFTGIDSPYEPPEQADLVVDTQQLGVAESVEQLTAFVLAQCRNTAAGAGPG